MIAVPTGDALTAPIEPFVAVNRRRHLTAVPDPGNDNDGTTANDDAVISKSPAALLATALAGGCSSTAAMVGLTWHNPNTPVLAEGPEIKIQPVGIRRPPSTITQVGGRGGDV